MIVHTLNKPTRPACSEFSIARNMMTADPILRGLWSDIVALTAALVARFRPLSSEILDAQYELNVAAGEVFTQGGLAAYHKVQCDKALCWNATVKGGTRCSYHPL